MSDEIKILRRIEKMLEDAALVNDLISRPEAIKFTGRTPGTFRSYLSKGKYNIASIGSDGQEYFSKKELAGLTNKLKIA